jgi:hypothetical protein
MFALSLPLLLLDPSLLLSMPLLSTPSLFPGKRNAVLHKGAGSIPRWFSDGSAKKLDFSPNASYCPSWYNPKATHGETASLNVGMPSWDIVGRARMVTVFVYQFKPAQDDQDSSMLLPLVAVRALPSIACVIHNTTCHATA